LTRVRAEKMREPRNPINGLLAPQDLVRLFAGYQTRPRYPPQAFRLLNLAISTNNIARGMVRGSQVRFQSTKNTLSSNISTNKTVLETIYRICHRQVKLPV
jgi:hypothetical protein